MKNTFFLTSLCLAMSNVALASSSDATMPKGNTSGNAGSSRATGGELAENTNPTEMELLLDSARWSKALDEVVVTGQGGAVQKRRLSSNVATVKPAEIARLNTGRIDELLQTAVPNLQINLSNGQPGATSVVRSRGISSVQINSTPVIYVDGIRMDNNNTATTLAQKLNEQGIRQASASGSLSDIPMENIERIEFVNGGAATTLYGSDAANGVIQIFTKKGGTGAITGMAQAQLGWDEASAQFYHYGRTKDLLNQSGLRQLYRFGLEGGGKVGGWSLGASAQFNDGTIVANNNRNKKYDVRFGAHLNLLPTLKYSTSLGFVHNDYRRSRNGNEGYYSGLWLTESGAASSMSYTDMSGNKVSYITNLDAMDQYQYQMFKELLYNSEAHQNKKTNVNRFQMSHELRYEPLQGLTVKGIFGLDYRYEGLKSIISNYLIKTTQYNGPTSVGNISEYERRFLSLTADLSAQYNYRPNDWLILITTAGFQAFGNHDKQYLDQAVDVEDGTSEVDDTNRTYSDSDRSTLYNYGAYLQENIGFLDRYYIDLAVRTDYNTGFGDNVGWQWYPKFGLSYMLTSEPFMQPLVDSGILGQLRLYANYGVAGNYPPAFAYQRTVVYSQYNGQQVAAFGQYGNDDLRPEKKHSFEVGLNSQWLNGYVQFGLAFYNAITRDALFSVHTTPSSGESTSYLANVGRIRNRGFEFTLGSDFIQTKNWHASLHASLNTFSNLVESTGGEGAFGIGTFATQTLIQNMVEEGKTIGYLRGNKAIFDADGNYVSTESLADLGSVTPDFYGSLSLNVDYKRFSFFANADYSVGGVVYDLDGHFRWRYGESDDRVNEAWVPAGKTHKQVWTNFTSCFIEDADYLKVRTIGATYTMPLKKHLKSITFGITVHNPFAFTKASVDPESCLSDAAAYGGASIGGIVYGSYTRPRQFLGSVRIDF